MSTRCVVTFKDQYGTHHVYRHSDGYPDGVHGVVASISKLLTDPQAPVWQGGRFEACDAGAGFIAMNKTSGGGYYLTNGPEHHCDLEFWYLLENSGGNLNGAKLKLSVYVSIYDPTGTRKLAKTDVKHGGEVYALQASGTVADMVKKYATVNV